MKRSRSVIRLLACVVLCLGIGAVGSYFTASEIPSWYARLNKPSWTPPNFAFPIVWTTLYLMNAVSLWLLWERSEHGQRRRLALGCFAAQLMLNAAWSPVFFGAHATTLALLILVGLIAAVFTTIWAAKPLSITAALLLVPYAIWSCYALSLNAGIVWLN